MEWSWSNIDWSRTLASLVGIAAIAQAVVAVFMMRGLRLSAETVRIALASLDHARTTAERQLRAYLDIADVEVRFPKEGDGVLRVVIANTGQTPAYGVATTLIWRLLFVSDIEKWTPAGPKEPEMRGLLPAGSSATLMSAVPRAEVMAHATALGARDRTLAAYVEVLYRDIYGHARRVCGRFHLEPDAHPTQLAQSFGGTEAD